MKRIGRLRKLIALWVCMAMGLLCACSSGAPISAQGEDAPRSQFSGYYTPDQPLSGGRSMRGQNLSDIEVYQDGLDTVMSLTFMDGSTQMGMEELPTKHVPQYATSFLPGVDRLVLQLTGLAFWDYKVYDDEIQNTLILGIFKQIPVDSESTYLYINTKDNFAYRMEEVNNKLLIYMRPINEQEHVNWYVTLNSFDEYLNGKLSPQLGLLPTLCSDKTNVALLSQPFDSQQQAQAFLDQIRAEVAAAAPGKVLSVVELANNSLPDHDEKGALDALANTPVLRRDNREYTSPALITNGRVLAWRPDAEAYVYVTPFFLSSAQGTQMNSYEKLYLNDLANTSPPTLLTDFEFSSILCAAFSPDGRYLAFIDQNEVNRSLYIYDFSTNEIITAAEAGFGVDTASFDWDDDSRTLYAITGEMDILQLMSYKIDAREPESTVTTLDERELTGGEIAYYDGCLYYSEPAETGVVDTVIMELNLQTQARKQLCAGYSFTLNKKTGVMAVLSDAPYKIANVSVLHRYTIATGELDKIIDNVDINEFVWSMDGTTLHYSVYLDVSASERFLLALHKWDLYTGRSEYLCDMVPAEFHPSNAGGELLLIRLYSQNNQFIPITYRAQYGELVR